MIVFSLESARLDVFQPEKAKASTTAIQHNTAFFPPTTTRLLRLILLKRPPSTAISLLSPSTISQAFDN